MVNVNKDVKKWTLRYQKLRSVATLLLLCVLGTTVGHKKSILKVQKQTEEDTHTVRPRVFSHPQIFFPRVRLKVGGTDRASSEYQEQNSTTLHIK